MWPQVEFTCLITCLLFNATVPPPGCPTRTEPHLVVPKAKTYIRIICKDRRTSYRSRKWRKCCSIKCWDTLWEINVADLNWLVCLFGITVIRSRLCVEAKRPETSTHTLTASVWTSPAYVSVCFGSIGMLHVDAFAAQRVWALTLVVLILFPDEHIHPELSGRVLHSSPSRHGSISHHHFPITMDAAEGEHRPIDKKKKK